MCQVYEKFVRDTTNAGIEIGRDDGIKIGETRGIALEKQNEVKMIQSLMKNANISLETAMDMLGLTSEKKQEFLPLFTK